MSSKQLVLVFFALSGCTRTTSLVADDTQAVFDTVEGAPFSERLFTFTNDGSDTTSPLAVQVSGDIHAFHIVNDGCTGVALKSGSRCSLGVQLASDDPGAFDGELRVTSTLAAAAVLLQGKVMPAQLLVAPDASPAIEVVQGQMVSLKLNISNTGGATTGALQVDTHSLASFVDVADDCAGKTLAGGASCTIALTRSVGPDAATGSSSSTLDVAASPGGAQSTPVSLAVRVGGTLVVDDVNWGGVPTLSGVPREVSVLNPGPMDSGPVTFQLADTSGAFQIGVDKCTNQVLRARESCAITVVANLYDTNVHTATLSARANYVKPGSGTLTAVGWRAHYTVKVLVIGNGTGKVHSGSTNYGDGEVLLFKNHAMTVPLTATPDSGSTFAGWSGTTPCTGTGQCAPFIGGDNADFTLTATFTQ